MPTTNTANQVSVGKPKISGAIYSAPLGTTLTWCAVLLVGISDPPNNG